VRFPPANVELRRAQLVLMLAVLVPTVLTTLIAIILLVTGGSYDVVAGILVITLCSTGITGYILGTIFVGKGASLVRIQNDFMSSVSHELRTPLTSIRLFMESLAGGKLPADQRDGVIKLLAREVDRLEELVNRVLELSRIETGREAIRREALDVEALIHEAVSAFDAATLSRPTAIRAHVESGLAMIGDRAMIVRALMNLLVNAWKYTDDDKQITVIARGAGRYVDITVKDNGIGIDAREQKNVFEEFHRAPAAIDRGTPGVGLGLAFVRAIARAHKGRVLLASRRGGGSEFTLRLRRGRVLAMPHDVPTPDGDRMHDTGAHEMSR
jgi:two-component system phosphate regulon sensor histidine kinase PhoR